MVRGSDATRQDDEESGYRIADPDTDPCLPPGKANFERGCLVWTSVVLDPTKSNSQAASYCDHPRVDVERVGDPEGHKVDVLPFPTLWFNWLQVMVGQEELLVAETRLGFTLLLRSVWASIAPKATYNSSQPGTGPFFCVARGVWRRHSQSNE